MKLISHRGNVNMINPERENTRLYVQEAIDLGYDVEIDIWISKNNNLCLGHDFPLEQIELSWLVDRKDKLWIHCKNFEALSFLINEDLRVFFYEKEDYSLISDNHIWAHNLSNINDKCIIPLLSKQEIEKFKLINVYGICSDFIQLLNKKL